MTEDVSEHIPSRSDATGKADKTVHRLWILAVPRHKPSAWLIKSASDITQIEGTLGSYTKYQGGLEQVQGIEKDF